MNKISRAWAFGWVVYLGITVGCSQAEAPGKDSQSAPAAAQSTSQGTTPAAKEATIGGPPPATAADLFPPGPARALTVDNCGSCHNLACSTIGQRPNARWDSLKTSHAEKVPALSAEDLNGIFDYLKANFNESKPEPKVPPKFLEGGCTPF